MNTQPINQEIKRQPKSDNLIKVIIVVVVSALITGTVIYFWLAQINKSEIENLKNNIATLEKEVSEIKSSKNELEKEVLSLQQEKDSFIESSKDVSSWEEYTNNKADFTIKYPTEWGPMESEVYRDAISGIGKVFYVLFDNNNLSISGNTSDYKAWEYSLPTYNGGDPFLFCENFEESVVSIEGCIKIDNNKTAITYGYYSDMAGLLLLHQVFIDNSSNEYKGINISYRYISEDGDLGNMEESQIKNEIKSKLKNIDEDTIKTINNIASTFSYIEN